MPYPVLAGQARAAGDLLAVVAVGPVHVARLQVDVAVGRVQAPGQAAGGLHVHALHAGHGVLRIDVAVAALDLERGDLGLAGPHRGAAPPVFGDLHLDIGDLAGSGPGVVAGRFDRDQGQRLAQVEAVRDQVLGLHARLQGVVQGDVEVLPGHAAGAARGRVGELGGIGAAHAAGHEAAQSAEHPAHVRHPGHVLGRDVDEEVGRRGLDLLAGGRQRDQGGGKREGEDAVSWHGGAVRPEG